MTKERFKALMETDQAFLTHEERQEGWHYCPDWDMLLINTNDQEAESCYCGRAKSC